MRSTLEADVVVIGGGQAGLCMGYELQRRGLRHVILDAASELGHSWRSRWDSLVLFTSASYSALPGLPFPGPPDRYPSKDEVADYLALYAATFRLPVRLGCRVTRVTRTSSSYLVETDAVDFESKAVVLATGAFQRPLVPSFSRRLAPHVFQIHTGDYHRPDQLPEGDVLVVGGGDSGTQIARELAQSRRVLLSRGKWRPYLPQQLLGRDIFWWLDSRGAMRVKAHSPAGRVLRWREPVVGASPRTLRRTPRLEVVGRVMDVRDGGAVLRGGRHIAMASVVWATGYGVDFSWIDVPVLDQHRAPLHRRGITRAAGLYFLGLPWLHSVGSGLIGWVGEDASYLASHIANVR